jgi:TPR repeat protein
MRVHALSAVVVLCLTQAGIAAETVKIDGFSIAAYDKSKFSQSPTECDKRAAFDIDRDRVTPGVKREDIDLAATIAVCKADLQKDPLNPRLNYQIARIYGYLSNNTEGDRHRRIAVEAGYPMAIFSIAYLRTFGPAAGRDLCQGGLLMRQAARAGAFSAEVGYTAYTLSGTFESCAAVPKDKAELIQFMRAAKQKAIGHIEDLLVESLTREVNRLP